MINFRNIKQQGAVLIIFSIAMALLESAVVIYLRALYYPDGFAFPMKPIDDLIGLTELLREAATLIMLAGIGYLTGKTALERRGWFMIAFGIWDIFYYVFLYLILQWPGNISDMDILFLIPVAWYGPVYAPCLISMALMGFGSLMVYNAHQSFPLSPGRWSKALFYLGCVIILGSFTLPYIRYCMDTGIDLRTGASVYRPEFNRLSFFSGFGLFCSGIALYAIHTLRAEKNRIQAYF